MSEQETISELIDDAAPSMPDNDIPVINIRKPRKVTDDYRTKLSRDIHADEARMKDVFSYILPDDLELRAAQYAEDDPQFITHLKRAHKYHQHKNLQGLDPWKVEVRARDDAKDTYNRHLMTRRSGLPTPEDIRDAGVSGWIRLMLTYYDPFKVTKGNERGGWLVISSKPIEILVPAAMVQGSNQRFIPGFSEPRPMPTPQDVSSVQAVFDSVNAGNGFANESTYEPTADCFRGCTDRHAAAASPRTYQIY